jgi:hypothetical protein
MRYNELMAPSVASSVAVRQEKLVVELADGRTLFVPLAWFPRLQHGSDAERRNCQIFGEGSAIEWPDLDEHIGVEGLLAGRRSGESAKSLERWLAGRNRS